LEKPGEVGDDQGQGGDIQEHDEGDDRGSNGFGAGRLTIAEHFVLARRFCLGWGEIAGQQCETNLLYVTWYGKIFEGGLSP
jgi:hypothetical protein